MQMTHKHKKWLQILVDEDFPRKLLWSENADLKFSVNNEGEDLNKKPLSPASKGKADNKKTEEQRNRRLEYQRHYDRFTTVENPHLIVCRFPRRYIDQSLQSFNSVLRPKV